MTAVLGQTTVPLVDLSRFASDKRDRFVQDFGEAVREFGFVRVEGHGVDARLIDRAYELVHQLFALPEQEKRRYDIPGAAGNRGYIPFGKERARGRDVSDLKEFWHVGRELGPSHPLHAIYTPNVWPEVLPVFRETMLALYDQLEECARQLLTALALYLDLPPDALTRMIHDGNSVLRAIHYPPVPEDAPPHALRAAEHEDINLITILCEATTGGLEILTRAGQWMPIDALDGQMVVDAGDMLKLVSNDVIPATTHRVTNPDGPNVSRYSLPFFVHPFPDCVLEPAATCVAPGRPAHYPPIRAGDFLDERLREIGLVD